MTGLFQRFASFGLLAVALAACSSQETILPGERIAVIADDTADLVVDNAAAAEGPGLTAAIANSIFFAPGQNPSHSGGHFMVAAPLKRAFSVDVGVSAELGTEMAQPVANANAVFTITPGGVVKAVSSQNGDLIWEYDLDPSEDDSQLSGTGGIALASTNRGEELYVHANKDVLVALNADNGQEKWRVEFDVFLTGGPSAANGAVVVTDLDGRVFVLSDIDGGELWNRIGAQDETGIVGSASPAIFGNELINVGSDGELLSLSLEQGEFLWGENLTPIELRTAIDGIPDIRAHPVHDGGMVFIISHSGKLLAFNAQTGRVIWDQPLQGIEMPWLSGQTLFVTTVDGRIYALRRNDGAIRWVTELPGAYDPSLSVVEDAPSYTSVVVASEKVIVASSTGQLHVLNANTGQIEDSLSTSGAVTTAPIIANSTIFVINRSGELVAFR
ncbi:MAG: PQQ-binding-like beta-propeller repeat protein [Alphaproteobacteria bacterium]|nr:PQQ-binding-like beta-propeller repeat protein [Alphaproteobacteria bacterium]